MSKPATILVVDDNDTGRYATCRSLTAAGFKVREASTGAGAMEGVRHCPPPDLVLLDVHLPDMSGTDVCRRLRAAPATASIPVVHLSATAIAPDDRITGLESGADAYLLEPVEPDVLLATVRACLRARAAEQALAGVRDELSCRLAELTRLHGLTRRLAGMVDLPAVLREVLIAVTEIQGAGMGNLLLYNAESGLLDSAATVGIAPEYLHLLTPVKPGCCCCGRAFSEKRSVMVEDVDADPVYCSYREAARSIGYQTVHSTPLLTLRGEALGTITTFFRQRRRPSGREMELVELYACQAAQAVENARLYGELAEKGRILDALMEHLPEGLVILDAAGRIRRISRNALQMAGFRDTAPTGRHYPAVMAPFRVFESEDAQTPIDLEQFPSSHAWRTGTVVIDEELILERPDGIRIPVLVNAAALNDAEGRVDGCVIAFRDIAIRKAYERRLQEARRLESVGLLAGGIAHDFNNILTSVLGGASLVLDMLPDAHAGVPVLRDVVASAERASHLTAQLLAYSGKGHYLLKNVDLSAVVNEMLGLLRNNIPATAVLQLDLAPDLPLIRADIAQLRELILSLVLNAAEALEEGRGDILLKTGVKDVAAERNAEMVGDLPAGSYVSLEVRDSGCGMDESVRARIFEPFFTTKFVGRGLGLPAALGVARGHNGGIEIASAPGRGSTFRVLFPALGAVAAGGRSILVVDDEELVIRVINLALKRAGFRPILARTGDEAMRLFEAARERISAVILDLRLPGMSGGEVLARMFQTDPGVKVLISTAYDEKRTLELVRGFGYSGFLQKPYTASTLLEKVEEVLAAPAAATGAGQ